MSQRGSYTISPASQTNKQTHLVQWLKWVFATQDRGEKNSVRVSKFSEGLAVWWLYYTWKLSRLNLLSICHPRKKKMYQRGSAAAMVILFAIRGIAFANGQGIGACLPIPVNSHSHSHSLKILGFGGRCQSRQKKKQTPTHTVTEIRGRCGEGGRGWGLSSSLFSIKKTANFGKAWNPWKIVIFWRKLPLRLASDSKKKMRSRAKFFWIPHSPCYFLKVLRKENESFPDSHSLRI